MVDLTPDFKIEVNGEDKTDVIKKHLTSLILTDEANNKSDSLSLTFDNLFKRPNYKDEIKVWLGYKESGLYFLGTFSVQTTTKTQNSLSLSATSINFTANLKEKKNRSFENLTLCDLISKIAGEHNLNSKCNFTDVFIKHLSQTGESDLHLLNRLSQMYNATFNIKNNTLIFIKKTEDDLPKFTIDKKSVASYSIKYANKTLYKSVKAMYHNTKENKLEEVVFGNGEPQYLLNDTFKDKQEALNRAKGALGYLNAGTVTGSLTIAGQNIIAGAKLELTGFGEDDGEYSIKKVVHNLSGSGYICRVEFEK